VGLLEPVAVLRAGDFGTRSTALPFVTAAGPIAKQHVATCEFVTSLADGYPGAMTWASSQVFLMGDRFKVVRSHAVSGAADVVKFKTIGDGPELCFPGDRLDRSLLASPSANPDTSVTVGVWLSGPEPTVGRLDDARHHPIKDRDACRHAGLL
jgi:hypothetical protein